MPPPPGTGHAHPPRPPLPAAVPLFPLPNVVLFPRAVLPLHIFEDRYRHMTADVLAGHRQVAMALLRPGWQKDYYARPAIEPVVCVGTILSHEKLPDGRYNFLLQGHSRARVVAEPPTDRPYRVATVEAVHETDDSEPALVPLRERLAALFEREAYALLPGGKQVRQMLAAGFPTADVADLLAFHTLADTDVALKQSILAEPNVRDRLDLVVRAVAALQPTWHNAPDNASMN